MMLLKSDRMRRRGGCFCCSKSSSTAFIARYSNRARRSVKSVLQPRGSPSDGGIFSSGICCNNFFVCRPCCLAFVIALPPNIVVAVNDTNTFVGLLLEYVNDWGRGDFCSLPDDVPCMACSVYHARIGGVPVSDFPVGVRKTDNHDIVDPTVVCRPSRQDKQEQINRCIVAEETGVVESLAGCMLFWPHCVLLRNYVGRYITHSVCRQAATLSRPGEDGIYHCVISEETASAVDMEKFFLHEKIAVKKGSVKMRHVVPRCPDRSGVGVCDRIVQWETYGIPNCDHVNECNLKGNQPTAELLMKCKVVEVDFSDDIDVFGLLLEPVHFKNDLFLGAHIYLDRRFERLPVNDDLYFSVSKRASHAGIVAERSGGALGQCDPSDEAFICFIKRRGLAPRVLKACLIIVMNSKEKCGFYVFYVTPYERKRRVIPWWYDTPRRGGTQVLTRSQVASFPLFDTFPYCRVETALLCDQFNLANERKVMSVACGKVLREWDEAIASAKERMRGSKHYVAKLPCLNVFAVHELALRSKHSLIEYSCGFHKDVSGRHGSDDIENKITLICMTKSTGGRFGVGRGGCGKLLYTYALMDWNNKTTSTSAVDRDGNAPSVRVEEQAKKRFIEVRDNV